MKIIRKVLIFVFLFIGVCSFTIKVSAEEYSKFQLSIMKTTDLGYGVMLNEHVGFSGSDHYSAYKGLCPQSVYTTSISKDSAAKVVQWAMNGGVENKWGSFTLNTIAKDYEAKNPGYKVLAATNNWLADATSENVGELDGPQMSQGLNYRLDDKQGDSSKWVFHPTYGYIGRPYFLGFDLTGKNAYYTDNWTSENYTDKLQLSYYNGHDLDNTLLNLDIDQINNTPNDGEIAIIFSNYSGDMNFSGAKIYKMKGERILHDNRTGSTFVERDAFALGTFEKVVETVDFTQTSGSNIYYIVSKDANFDKLELEEKRLLAQYELLNEFKDVVGGTTYYYHIVRDGVAYPGVEGNMFGAFNEINCEVHPRTAFIIKKDGSFAISVIPGRNQAGGYTGMDYEQMAKFYTEYLDAKEVFNYDGGGSSAMIVANDKGGFDTVNYLSDGRMRGVANAILIVVKEPIVEVTLDEATSKSLTIKANIIDKCGHNFEDLYVRMGSKVEKFVDGKVTFSSLSTLTKYRMNLFYYSSDNKEISILDPYYFATKPVEYRLRDFEFISTEEEITINLYYLDRDNATTLATAEITINGKSYTLNNGSVTVNKADVGPRIKEITLKFDNKLLEGKETIILYNPHAPYLNDLIKIKEDYNEFINNIFK